MTPQPPHGRPRTRTQSLLVLTLLLTTICTLTTAQDCVCNEVPPPSPPTSMVPHLHAIAISLLSGAPALPHRLALVSLTIHNAHVATLPPSPDASPVCLSAGLPADTVPFAAFAALQRILASDPDRLRLLRSAMAELGLDIAALPGHVGTQIAIKVLMTFPLMPTPFENPNPPSPRFDAACGLIRDPDAWQPQCIQSAPGQICLPQMIPFLPLRDAPLITSNGLRESNLLIANVAPPPRFARALRFLPFETGQNDLADEHLAVLAESARLDDRRKAIAELFAPSAAVQAANLALSEISARNLSDTAAATLLLAVTAAVRDGLVAAVTVKLRDNTARSHSIIQCAYRNRTLTSWNSPYRGVRTYQNVDDDLWRSYIPTPPFPGYVSGHTTIAAAAALVLRELLSTPRGANCRTLPAGMSFVEPRVERGAFGYIPGVTDVPNRGPGTVGYSPARDVTVCWPTFDRFAGLTAESRLFGGVHTNTDNIEGIRLGRVAARRTLEFIRGLHPELRNGGMLDG